MEAYWGVGREKGKMIKKGAPSTTLSCLKGKKYPRRRWRGLRRVEYLHKSYKDKNMVLYQEITLCRTNLKSSPSNQMMFTRWGCQSQLIPQRMTCKFCHTTLRLSKRKTLVIEAKLDLGTPSLKRETTLLLLKVLTRGPHFALRNQNSLAKEGHLERRQHDPPLLNKCPHKWMQDRMAKEPFWLSTK